MVVVDSSVLVSALVDDADDGAWCRQIASGIELNGPQLVMAEVTNILRRMESSGRITIPEAELALEVLLRADLV